MRVFRRPRDQFNDPAATDFIWGVPRREGHSDTDDPSAHAGVIQHAFEFGRDDRAICGFEAPKRASRAYRDARPQLAVPGRANPKCRKCELLVATRVRGDESVPAMDAAARDGRSAGLAETDLTAGAIYEVAEDGDTEAVADARMVGGREVVDEQPDVTRSPEPAPATEAELAAESEQANASDQTAENPQAADVQQAPELEPAAAYDVDAETALHDTADEEPNDGESVDFDALGGARDPDFHPRGQAERARRRSVRRGGTVLVGPGKRSVLIEVPISTEIAGIVANVEPEIEDVRVEAVTVGNDGTVRVTLNRPAPQAVEVAWYIVSNPFRESA